MSLARRHSDVTRLAFEGDYADVPTRMGCASNAMSGTSPQYTHLPREMRKSQYLTGADNMVDAAPTSGGAAPLWEAKRVVLSTRHPAGTVVLNSGL